MLKTKRTAKTKQAREEKIRKNIYKVLLELIGDYYIPEGKTTEKAEDKIYNIIDKATSNSRKEVVEKIEKEVPKYRHVMTAKFLRYLKQLKTNQT